MYNFKYLIKEKKIIYKTISIETLQMGVLNENPFSIPQEEIKNIWRIKWYVSLKILLTWLYSLKNNGSRNWKKTMIIKVKKCNGYNLANLFTKKTLPVVFDSK